MHRKEVLGVVEVRCPLCGKKLCLTDGNTEIKCNKCKAMVRYNTKSGNTTARQVSERTSLSGKRFY